MVKYYKNGNRYTAILDKLEYIEVLILQSHRQVGVGTNKYRIADCEILDVEITEEEFDGKLKGFELMYLLAKKDFNL